ncbi:MAG TPA: ribonuclease P protein component [Campylobacterales bacterium]|nr:ribonuclease P protein component [Campylobacterales bacterium]HIO71075.1 ribonuclease P protein component [Campylobacterales bacterium]
MSCLKHRYRIKQGFQEIYQTGKQYHRPAFVIFYKESEERLFGFISSKKVGNSVQRNRGKRLLREVVQHYCDEIRNGLYILVAKKPIHTTPYQKLLFDFKMGLKYLYYK